MRIEDQRDGSTAWMEKQNAKHGCVFVIRYSASAGFTLIPPALSDGHGWLGIYGINEEQEHPLPALIEVGWT